MTVAVLSPNHVRAIRLASSYCATLAATEHAFMTGDDTELHAQLSTIDRIDAREVANTLHTLWRVLAALPEPDRGGPTGVATVELPSSSPDVSAADPTDGRVQPSAPTELHQYSVKVPSA